MLNATFTCWTVRVTSPPVFTIVELLGIDENKNEIYFAIFVETFVDRNHINEILKKDLKFQQTLTLSSTNFNDKDVPSFSIFLI